MQKHTFFSMSKHVFDDIFCQRKFVKYQIEVKTPLLTKNVNKLPRLFSPFLRWDIRYFSDFFQKSCFVNLLMSFLRLKIKLRKLIFCCCFSLELLLERWLYNIVYKLAELIEFWRHSICWIVSSSTILVFRTKMEPQDRQPRENESSFNDGGQVVHPTPPMTTLLNKVIKIEV